MPSEFQRASNEDPDHPAYPQLADVYGEDPGRFLYVFASPLPRIKTLDEEGIQNYLYVETEEQARHEIVAALNKRRAVLRGDIDSMDDEWGVVDTDTAGGGVAPRDESSGEVGSEADSAMATADHNPHAGAPRADGAGQADVENPEEIAALLDADRAAELLERERAKDEPREAVIEALEAVVA